MTTTFKTAAELGIKQADYNALLQVLEKLEAGTIEYTNTDSAAPYPKGLSFNMNYSAHERGCGTVCCIGGWMYALQHGTVMADGTLEFHVNEANNYVNNPYSYVRDANADLADEFNISELFYPTLERDEEDVDTLYSYSKITPADAAKAIRNYLATNEPSWNEVLGLETNRSHYEDRAFI